MGANRKQTEQTEQTTSNYLTPHTSKAHRWDFVYPSGTAPAARSLASVVWSDAAKGFYVFAGSGNSGAEVAMDQEFLCEVCSPNSASTGCSCSN